MIKLKDILKEQVEVSKSDVKKMEKHQEINGVVKEASPKMRTKPGQKELRAIVNKLEILKRVDISSRHRSKFISAIKSAQKSISKIESIIRMSSTL